MSEQRLPVTFRDLLLPLEIAEFFGSICGQQAKYIRGKPDKFHRVFSWAVLNQLFDMTTLWSSQLMSIVLDGRRLAASEYCEPGLGRDGKALMRPEAKRVNELLNEGATVILNGVERLTEGVAEVTDALEMGMGGPTACNVYCSFENRAGFDTHFDTTDVFALHIEGEKTWRIYEGRFEHPLDESGYNYASFTRAHHERAKGEVVEELTMRAGDVLYIPRGQYHDALASSEASLHLSFGVNHTTGLDLLKLVLGSLADVAVFRQFLPNYDRVPEHDAHIALLADKLHDLLSDPKMATQVREIQRRSLARDAPPRFALPSTAPVARYRVKRGIRLVEDSEPALVLSGYPPKPLSGWEAEAVRWILHRDQFTSNEFAQAFADVEPMARHAYLITLDELDALERY